MMPNDAILSSALSQKVKINKKNFCLALFCFIFFCVLTTPSVRVLVKFITTYVQICVTAVEEKSTVYLPEVLGKLKG